MSQNGKGDSPRNCYSAKYRKNYDEIFRRDSGKSKKDPGPIARTCDSSGEE